PFGSGLVAPIMERSRAVEKSKISFLQRLAMYPIKPPYIPRSDVFARFSDVALPKVWRVVLSAPRKSSHSGGNGALRTTRPTYLLPTPLGWGQLAVIERRCWLV